MSAVFSVAAPVFAIIAVGFAAARLAGFAAADVAALNKFVFRLAMPAALFGLAARTAPPGADDAGIVAAYAGAALIALAGGYLIARVLFSQPARDAGAHAFSSTIGNAVFLGLPIALSIDGWARPFIVLMLIEGTVVIAIGAALMAARGAGDGVAAQLSKALRNPLIIAMAAGFTYSALGLPLYGPAETFFDYLGRAAGPTALVSLGLFLATHPFPKVQLVGGRVAAIAAVKLALLPAVALSLAMALGVDDRAYLGALALFTFVPTGVVSFVMASQYKIYQTEAAAAVLATTLLSIVTISGVLAAFS